MLAIDRYNLAQVLDIVTTWATSHGRTQALSAEQIGEEGGGRFDAIATRNSGPAFIEFEGQARHGLGQIVPVFFPRHLTVEHALHFPAQGLVAAAWGQDSVVGLESAVQKTEGSSGSRGERSADSRV